ncbi:hypothetical protein BDP81DRAFT_415998 [Colletotrichum phormii]|uniref:Uncharacterized protein n=1 Tax=Colletotrichum phormii TaxID=359342 RepID=A0AAJ0EMF0_9PEZI|nr:uncharacterized protein BDP81DRAFT_415998 [Colletotrichum phormii]KAK1654544.1 hypothetical protein BDP81DRAFT_415998 [Colletotrichum phormii]
MRIASVLLYSLLYWKCTGSTVFRRPPGAGPTGDFRDNPQYALGEMVDLQWGTDDSPIDLFIIQASPERDPVATLFLDEHRPQGWTWRVSFNGFPDWHDPNLSNAYYLRILPAGQTDPGTTCHYFNITGSAASSPSSSLSPSSSTLSSVSSPTRASSATSTPKPGGDELSGGAVAGIAIGATAGTLVVVGIAGFLFWRRWKNNKKGRGEEAAAATTASDTNEINLYKRDTSVPSRELYGESARPFEAEGSEPSDMRFEMSGDSVTRSESVGFHQAAGRGRY